RITCALVRLLSPSVKATAPAAFNRPISVISSPASPLVSAAIGWMLTIAVSRAGFADKGAHVDETRGNNLARAIDDVGAFGHAGRTYAALVVANDAVGNQHVAYAVEVARRVDHAGIRKQDRAAVGQHRIPLRQCPHIPRARLSFVKSVFEPNGSPLPAGERSMHEVHRVRGVSHKPRSRDFPLTPTLSPHAGRGSAPSSRRR